MTAPADDDPWHAFVVGEPASRSDRMRDLTQRAVSAARLPAKVATGLLLAGAPAGLVWARVSPRISVSFTAQGPSLDHPESSEFFATDASFLVVLLIAGLLTGAVVWAFTRGRGVGVPVGIAVGGVLAGVVARAVGSRVVVDDRLARVCTEAACLIYDGTLHVRSSGLVVVWAVSALGAFLALTAVFDGADEPPTPAAWPAPAAEFDWAPPDRVS